ncbi:protein transport protein Sec31A isoform X4 [Bacillus rossius redtenbacheri]|uniref:protein transport protein Sec31A isoform X4 n=1 Tax=Bacillus rossius redtenbacheri TaxID=93214 RepID=UPI002FDDE57E
MAAFIPSWKQDDQVAQEPIRACSLSTGISLPITHGRAGSMKVKEAERTANLAWSPAAQHPVMLAAGTAAQQLDASFSTAAQLELCTLGLARPGLDMEVRASVPSEHRYHKVVWGEAAGGVIVGGCDGGRVQMYSAAKLLAGEESIVASKDKHVGPVRSLDFNPYQVNLLATGASESEIFIWDLNNTDTPMLPGAKSHPADDVLSLSWNRQVQHILASAFAQRCVVWDLRKNEPIIKLADSSSRVRWKALAWHPDVATQLCLASEEDQLPVIQLWDLRFASSPVKALHGHQRGVLSVAWCAQDPDLLASCGKENHIIIWNPNATDQSGEIVCDLTTTNQWHFDISWCPRNPALIACSSFDGHTSVYSLTGGQQQAQTSNKIADSFPGMDAFAQAPSSQPQAAAVDLRRAPRWLRRPCRAAFGFGGKLATFEWEAGGARRLVYVSQVVTEPQLVERSQLLEQVLQCGQLAEFCDDKAADARSPHHKQMWRFLRARLSTDPRTELLALLGFKQDDVVSKLNRYLDKPANAKLSDGVENLTGRVAALGQEDHRQVNGVTAANFVNSAENISSEPLKIFTDDDGSGLISQALLLGNTEAAVELCLQEERFADAIILAMTGGSDLLARTQFRYFQKCKGALSALISAVVTEDWSHVVRNCSLDSWKEALAATLTHTKSDEFPALCGELAERLAAEGKDSVLSAQLCLVCAGDLDRLVHSWTAVFQPDTPDNLQCGVQELVELAVVLRKAAETTGRVCAVSGQLAQLLSRYAGLLAAQGSLGTALAYLQDSADENLSLLRERLFCALGHKQAYQQQQPLQQGRGARRTSAQGWQAQSVSADESNYGKPYPSAGGYCAPDSKLFPVKTSKPIPPAQQQYQPLMAQPFSTGVHPYGSQPPAQPYGSQPPAQPYGSQTPSQSYGSQPLTQPYGSQPPAQPYGSHPPAQPYGSQTPSQSYGSQPLTQPYSSQPPVQTYGSQPPAQPYGTQLYGQTQTYTIGPRASSSPAPATLRGSPAPPADVPAQSVPQQFQQTAAADSAPAGWNDPPSLGPVRAQPRVEYAPQTPITHPLYGTVPAEQPGSFAPPSAGGYAEPAHSYAPPEQQRPPTPATPREAVPPTQKPPLPEEFMYLQTVFDELRARCLMAAANAQTKRKLEDVARKLEALYDALRACKLSPQTVQGLHQMVQMVQIGDYQGCLGLHTQLVSGPDFSQIASFMPGLKVLVQSALQLGVYLQ